MITLFERKILLLITIFHIVNCYAQFDKVFFEKGSNWNNVDIALSNLGSKKDKHGQMYTKETHPKYYRDSHKSLLIAQKHFNKFKNIAFSKDNLEVQRKEYNEKYRYYNLAIEHYLKVLDSGVEDLAAIVIIDLIELLSDYSDNYKMLGCFQNDNEKLYFQREKLKIIENFYKEIDKLLGFYIMYYSDKQYFNDDLKCMYLKYVYFSGLVIESVEDIFNTKVNVDTRQLSDVAKNKYLEGMHKAIEYQIESKCIWFKKIEEKIKLSEK